MIETDCAAYFCRTSIKSNRMKIYLISGLGADQRAFRKLRFPDTLEVIHLDWIPARRQESLVEYAARLAEKIDTKHPFYLLGLSFGGMLATEIAKKLKPVHTFLISSTPTFKELPWYYRLAGQLNLEKLVPLSLLKKANSIGLKLLGARSPEERKLLQQLVIDSDPVFMKWALTAILKWRNLERPPNLSHLHGNNDLILPMKYTRPEVIIQHAGHFMVYANAKEINTYLSSKLVIETDAV
jgi:pimeloyl-ACP methyl ester carboxylesterase